MQGDEQYQTEDTYGFWADEPTRWLHRTPSEARIREHVASPNSWDRRDSAARLAGWLPNRLRRGADGRFDPFVVRVGALFAALILLIPVALSMQSDKPSLLHARSTGGAAAIPGGGDAGVDTQASVGDTAGVDSTTGDAALAAPPSANAAVTAGTTAAAQEVERIVQKRQPKCSTSYTVRRGDYWYRIARNAKVSVQQLLLANRATTSTPLYPGRTICLPATGGASTPTTLKPVTTTTVKPVTTTTVKKSTPTTTTVKPKVTTTTAKPTPTTQPPPPRTYTQAQVIQIIRDVWPDNLEDKAIAIATRESNLVPTARNACCYGLFQIYFSVHKAWLATIGVTSASQLLDPRVNAYAALVLYNRAGGWGPWGG